jgi:hypothetical protein
MYSGVPNTAPARVSRGPSEPGRHRPGGVERRDLRDAEVDDLDEVASAVAVDEEDVLGLEIAVDDALVVGRAQRLRDLRGDRQRAIGRHRRRQLDRLRQRLAVDVLHHRVGQAVGRGAEVGDVDDVGVADARRRLGLLHEALDRAGVARDLALEHLHRQRPLDDQVARGEHHAHAALADLALDQVAPVERHPDQLVVGGVLDRPPPAPAAATSSSSCAETALTGNEIASGGIDRRAPSNGQ